MHFNRCTNKNVDGIKLIELLLCDNIVANVFASSACGLQSLPRTHPELSADSGLRNTTLALENCSNPLMMQKVLQFRLKIIESLYFPLFAGDIVVGLRIFGAGYLTLFFLMFFTLSLDND